MDEIDGYKYRICICWRVAAGCSHACIELCSDKQREACKEAQKADNNAIGMDKPREEL
jgi:hypothetical protein